MLLMYVVWKVCRYWVWITLYLQKCLPGKKDALFSKTHLCRGVSNIEEPCWSFPLRLDSLLSFVSSSLLAMPRLRPSIPRNTERSSFPRPCRRPSLSATPPSTHCPPRTAKPKQCTNPWASSPDLRPQAFRISRSTGEQPTSLLQPWPSYHTQVSWLLFPPPQH